MDDRDRRVDHRDGGKDESRAEAAGEPRVDRLIASLAARRWGVVSRTELLDAGVSRRIIDRRLASGRLHPLHRGVYAVGHTALHPQAVLAAALLVCGAGSALSHRTAAVAWGMLAPADPPVHVTRDGPRRDARAGVRLHHAPLPPGDLRHHRRLPITSPARTLLDLAATEPDDVAEALNEALVLRLLRPQLIRVPAGHRGAEVLRRALAPDDGFTRSRAERLLLALVVRAGLPRPRTNVRLQGREVDALWPDHRLIVEVDGFAGHGRRRAFEADRARDAAHLIAGYRTLRLTWRQLIGGPEAVAALLGAALAAAAPERLPPRAA